MHIFFATPARSRFRSTTTLIVSILFLFTPLAAQAANYAPGETTNPSCAPGDANCGVSSVVGTGSTGQVPYYAATGGILSATSTFQILSSGTASTTNLVVSNSFTLGALSGFLKATAGVLATALVNLTSDVTGTLPVANGGTASSTSLGGILVGNGLSAIKSLVVGTGLTFDGTTLATNGSGVTSLGGVYSAGQTGGTQTLATSTADTNLGMTIVSSGNTHSFTPYWIGTLADSRISSAANWNTAYNNRITSATYPLSISSNTISTVATSSLGLTVVSFVSPNISQWTNNAGYLTSLTGAASSTILADSNTFSGTNTFSNTIIGSVSGNAGTVTNGVYTTGAGTVFLAPNGSAASLISFPTLNQNTTGTAANVTGIVALANGGTGVSSFTPNQILYTNGAGAIVSVATSSLGVVLTASNLTGIVAVSNGGTGVSAIASGFIPFGNGANAIATSSSLYWDSANNRLGLGTTTPWRGLSLLGTVSVPQFALAYDATRYAQMQTDASGDLSLSASGGNLRLADENLFVCAGGACPIATLSTKGNIVVEDTVYAAAFGPVSCPSGMIPVPASPADGTQGFCVDKYEAQSSSGNEVSVQGGSPWVSITQTGARAECIRAGKHLITESEWQAIAHNAENIGWNWNGGVAGTNQMSDGHSDNSPASALATAADTSPCSGTGQTCDASTWDSQRRTYKLSNGEYIWDFGGNVWELIDQTVTGDYPIVNSAAAGWQVCSTSGDGVCGNTRTTNDQWYRGGFNTIAAFIRGGAWSDGSVTGVFALALSYAPSGAGTGLGFRCSR